MRHVIKKMRRLGKPVLCLVLAATFPVNLNLICHAQAQELAKEKAEKARQEELKMLAEKLEKLFDALEEAQKEIPRDTFDPLVIINGQKEAGIEGVGKDPEKLFQWVRDNTYLVPYRGVLRDYKGVLMDRLGNSLDRSLLLMRLLYDAGHKSLRLAHAQLSDEQASELLKKARPIPEQGALPQVKQLSPEELEARLRKQAERYGIDPAALREAMDEMNLKSQRLAEKAVQRTFEQSQMLVKMLRKKNLIPSRESQMKKLRADAIKALKHHWWVQWYNGKNWVDLDPSLPDAAPSKPLVKMQQIVPGNELTKRLRNEMHVIQIRVMIERLEGGKLVELPVLTQELFPAAFIGERIAIHHAPTNWPKDLNLLKEKKPLEALKKAVLKQHEWIPVLSVGDKRVSKYGFTDRGEITNPTLPGFVKNALAGKQLANAMERGVKIVGQRVFNLLARTKKYDPGAARPTETNGQLKANKPKVRSQLTAEWIEYEIRIPGANPKKVQRQLFDLIGPAQRTSRRIAGSPAQVDLNQLMKLNRALTLVGKSDILVQVGSPSIQYSMHLEINSILLNRKAFIGSLRNFDTSNADTLLEQLVDRRFAKRLLSLVFARTAFSLHGNQTYLDQPNILGAHRLFIANEATEVSLLQAFDIVNNRVAVCPHSTVDPFLIRVVQGVLDTNAEALLLHDNRPPENASEVFQTSTELGVFGTTINNTRNLSIANLRLPGNIQQRLKDELTEGYVIVAPSRPVSLRGHPVYAWWRIDPNSGSVIGVGSRGWGQSSAEYFKMLTTGTIGIVAAVSCATFVKKNMLRSRTARKMCLATAICGALPIALFLFPYFGTAYSVVMMAMTPSLYTGWFGMCSTLGTLASGAEALNALSGWPP